MLTPEQVQQFRSQYGLGQKAPNPPAGLPVSNSAPTGQGLPTSGKTTVPADFVGPINQNTQQRALPSKPLPDWYTELRTGKTNAQTAGATHPLNPLNPDFQKNSDKVMEGVKQGTMRNLPGVVVSGVKDYGKNVAKDYYEATKASEQAIEDAGNGKQSPLSAGLQAAGNFAGSVFSPITEAVKPSVQAAAEGLSNNPIFQKFANSASGDAIAHVENAYNTWKEQHPEASKNAEAVANIVMLLTGEKPTNAAGDVVGAGAKTAAETVGNAAKTVGKTVEEASAKAIAEADAASKAALEANAGKSAAKADAIAGKIAQGTTEDIASTKSALGSVDTTGVKTFSDLSGRLSKKISDLSGLQDKAFDTAKPNEINLKDLKYNGHNYVNDAIDQMRTYYEKTNDIQGLKQINALATKAETQGLTVKEVNQLAREHGSKLNAYNANGELASGLTKKAAENTRQGLKSTARELSGNPSLFTASDKQLSDVINTKGLIDDMVEKVNKAQQKAKERGFGAKVGDLIGKVVDISTGGGIKTFLSHFIKSAGEGSMNAIDIQNALSKNLTKLQKILDSGASEATVEKQLQDLINKGPQQKALPAPSGEGAKVQNNVPRAGAPGPADVMSATKETSNMKRTIKVTPRNTGSGSQKVPGVFPQEAGSGRFDKPKVGLPKKVKVI